MDLGHKLKKEREREREKERREREREKSKWSWTVDNGQKLGVESKTHIQISGR